MLQNGVGLEGVEWGNAWDLRDPAYPHTNWFVGCNKTPQHGVHPLVARRLRGVCLGVSTRWPQPWAGAGPGR